MIARPHQLPPSDDAWDLWLLLGGRDSGKTRAGAEYVLEHLSELGPAARVGIGAPTLADARDTCAEGHSGLITIARDQFPLYNRSLLEARHYKGGYVKFMGSESPDRWNGPQWTLLWADELALWNQAAWEQAQFGVRLGRHPRTIATTTPKARKFVKALMEDPETRVSHGTMYDNPGASPAFIRRIERRYGGTRLGRQEIMGEYVDDVEGALWQRAWIENARVREIGLSAMKRIVTSVDPAGSKNANSNETGIAACGKGNDGDYYVFFVQGYVLSPNGWGNKAVETFRRFGADKIIAERNYGGDMVESTIRQVWPDVPLKTISASRGKVARAEPVAALYEQGRVHHVGMFPDAEDQMCSFPIENELDDLVDAIVWGISELMEEQEVSWWG